MPRMRCIEKRVSPCFECEDVCRDECSDEQGRTVNYAPRLCSMPASVVFWTIGGLQCTPPTILFLVSYLFILLTLLLLTLFQFSLDIRLFRVFQSMMEKSSTLLLFSHPHNINSLSQKLALQQRGKHHDEKFIEYAQMCFWSCLTHGCGLDILCNVTKTPCGVMISMKIYISGRIRSPEDIWLC